VLVALDHESADRIGAFMHGFFGPFEVEVIAVSIARAPSPWIPPGIGWGGIYPWGSALGSQLTEQAMTDQADDAVTDADRLIDDSDLDENDRVVELGDPAELILTTAETHHVDLIVLGASDSGLLQRILQPSVASAVARRSTVPVLLVP
jgi:nucleotide-binding universal stress UspA family protein